MVWPESGSEEMVTDDDWQRISVEIQGSDLGAGDFEIVFEGVMGEPRGQCVCVCVCVCVCFCVCVCVYVCVFVRIIDKYI